ncbi:MAG: CAP domain-containing protein [Paracoccaceae bacterium]|nr:CAP domain-containing protein [Paracoccaceae bacterium]
MALFATATIAEACTRNIPARAAEIVVPTKRINQGLFDAAVRAEVNYHRCRAGLRPVGDAGSGVAGVARGHSNWMASRQVLSHRSTIPGKASLSQRIKSTGVQYRTGSENIGMVHRYRIDNRRFKILDSGSCKFATYDGRPLPAHSYASLARHIVQLWMESPGHRKNILDRRATRTAVAVAFDPRAQYCGRYWVTQNFIG